MLDTRQMPFRIKEIAKKGKKARGNKGTNGTTEKATAPTVTSGETRSRRDDSAERWGDFWRRLSGLWRLSRGLEGEEEARAYRVVGGQNGGGGGGGGANEGGESDMGGSPTTLDQSDVKVTTATVPQLTLGQVGQEETTERSLGKTVLVCRTEYYSNFTRKEKDSSIGISTEYGNEIITDNIPMVNSTFQPQGITGTNKEERGFMTDVVPITNPIFLPKGMAQTTEEKVPATSIGDTSSAMDKQTTTDLSEATSGVSSSSSDATPRDSTVGKHASQDDESPGTYSSTTSLGTTTEQDKGFMTDVVPIINPISLLQGSLGTTTEQDKGFMTDVVPIINPISLLQGSLGTTTEQDKGFMTDVVPIINPISLLQGSLGTTTEQDKGFMTDVVPIINLFSLISAITEKPQTTEKAVIVCQTDFFTDLESVKPPTRKDVQNETTTEDQGFMTDIVPIINPFSFFPSTPRTTTEDQGFMTDIVPIINPFSFFPSTPRTTTEDQGFMTDIVPIINPFSFFPSTPQTTTEDQGFLTDVVPIINIFSLFTFLTSPTPQMYVNVTILVCKTEIIPVTIQPTTRITNTTAKPYLTNLSASNHSASTRQKTSMKKGYNNTTAKTPNATKSGSKTKQVRDTKKPQVSSFHSSNYKTLSSGHTSVESTADKQASQNDESPGPDSSTKNREDTSSPMDSQTPVDLSEATLGMSSPSDATSVDTTVNMQASQSDESPGPNSSTQNRGENSSPMDSSNDTPVDSTVEKQSSPSSDATSVDTTVNMQASQSDESPGPDSSTQNRGENSSPMDSSNDTPVDSTVDKQSSPSSDATSVDSTVNMQASQSDESPGPDSSTQNRGENSSPMDSSNKTPVDSTVDKQASQSDKSPGRKSSTQIRGDTSSTMDKQTTVDLSKATSGMSSPSSDATSVESTMEKQASQSDESPGPDSSTQNRGDTSSPMDSQTTVDLSEATSGMSSPSSHSTNVDSTVDKQASQSDESPGPDSSTQSRGDTSSTMDKQTTVDLSKATSGMSSPSSDATSVDSTVNMQASQSDESPGPQYRGDISSTMDKQRTVDLSEATSGISSPSSRSTNVDSIVDNQASQSDESPGPDSSTQSKGDFSSLMVMDSQTTVDLPEASLETVSSSSDTTSVYSTVDKEASKSDEFTKSISSESSFSSSDIVQTFSPSSSTPWVPALTIPPVIFVTPTVTHTRSPLEDPSPLSPMASPAPETTTIFSIMGDFVGGNRPGFTCFLRNDWFSFLTFSPVFRHGWS